MLARNKTIWTLGAVVLLVVGLAYVRAAEVAGDDSAGHFKAMAVAAQQTHAQLLRLLATGQPGGSVDEIYLWSRRALDAESRVGRGNPRALLDAAKAHQKRVEDLSEAVAKLVTAGERFKTGATEYYRWEAKALVADASRGK